MHETDQSGSMPSSNRSILCWLAFLVACAGLAGSLALSMALKLKPCPLCYYQRAVMMALIGLLLIGLLARVDRLGLVAFPIAVMGLGVAIFHVYLEGSGKLECPAGLFALGSAPQQSLATYAVITLLLAAEVLRGRAVGIGVVGIVVGALLAFAASTTNPPPPKPTAPYASAPDICRPPFHAPE
jgi:disulfide bond formation protein DsbB